MNKGIFVDKTKEYYEIVKPGDIFYFCARPRRMGKTLTLKTIKALYEGK
jgi:hypothetical protein